MQLYLHIIFTHIHSHRAASQRSSSEAAAKFSADGVEVDREEAYKGRMLYDYEAQNEGELTINAGEVCVCVHHIVYILSYKYTGIFIIILCIHSISSGWLHEPATYYSLIMYNYYNIILRLCVMYILTIVYHNMLQNRKALPCRPR